ncbi:MAG TPA: PilZ domain-containing protein [Desulfomonilaceae bacterium]|nr:PilZ domain-containing protein [Desulfomonilaceae bacterium]
MKKQSKTIDGKTVLSDVKAGMSHSALMEKYGLSAAGLESLLRKLGESGIIRYVSTNDIVQDLKAGISDSQLMEKYKVSEEALRRLLKQLERMAFFNETPDPRVKPSEGVISGKEIVHDIRSGMTRWELMLKYGFSGEQLKKAFEIIMEERRKVAIEIAEDVRSGMRDSGLMAKYQLSNSGLQKVCQNLLSEGLLESADIEGLKSPSDNGTSLHHERRQISRRSPSLQITVCDRSNDSSRGIVKDITEKGLAVRGIEADIGELKTLSILGDDLGFVDPFELEAECRWVGSEGSAGHLVAGFQVVAISDEDLQKLQEFIDFLDFKSEATL